MSGSHTFYAGVLIVISGILYLPSFAHCAANENTLSEDITESYYDLSDAAFSQEALSRQNIFKRIFGSRKTKAETLSRSRGHQNSSPKRFLPPESNSVAADQMGRGPADNQKSNVSSVQNTTKEPLHTSLRDSYYYRGVWEVGISAGTAHSITDIADNKNLPLSEFAKYQTQNYDVSFGFFARYTMNSWFAIKLGIDYASLGATNLSLLETPGNTAVRFKNDIFEFYANTEFMVPSLARSPVGVYGFVGIGIFFTDALLYDANDRLLPVNDDFSQVQPVIPAGFGIFYKATDRLRIGYEFGWRHTVFHYLDAYKASSESYDKYFLNTLKVSYKF